MGGEARLDGVAAVVHDEGVGAAGDRHPATILSLCPVYLSVYFIFTVSLSLPFSLSLFLRFTALQVRSWKKNRFVIIGTKWIKQCPPKILSLIHNYTAALRPSWMGD